jgi:hypothetical protein
MAAAQSKSARHKRVIPPVSLPNSPLSDAQLASLISALARGSELAGQDIMVALTELRDYRVAQARKAVASELRELRKRRDKQIGDARNWRGKSHEAYLRQSVADARHWNSRIVQTLVSARKAAEIWT